MKYEQPTEKASKYVTRDEVQNFRKEDLIVTGTAIAKVDQDVTHLTGIVGNIVNAGIHTEKNVKALGTAVENLENKFKTTIDRTAELSEEVSCLKECVTCLCDETEDERPGDLEATLADTNAALESLSTNHFLLSDRVSQLQISQDEMRVSYNAEFKGVDGRLNRLEEANIYYRHDCAKQRAQIQELLAAVSRLQTSLRNIENGAPANGKQYRILLSSMGPEGPYKYFIQKWSAEHSVWLSTDCRLFRWKWQAKRHLRNVHGKCALEQLQ